jgi:hypothetical protein
MANYPLAKRDTAMMAGSVSGSLHGIGRTRRISGGFAVRFIRWFSFDRTVREKWRFNSASFAEVGNEGSRVRFPVIVRRVIASR